MAGAIGRKRWAIADGYVPDSPTSRETACLLNAGDDAAHVEITVFFGDRDPAGPYRMTIPARRTSHLRLDELTDPEPLPRETPYAAVVESDVPIVVQHARLDARQAGNALLTTVAFPADG